MMLKLRQSLIFENNNELTVRLLVDGANWFRVLTEYNRRFMLRITWYINMVICLVCMTGGLITPIFQWKFEKSGFSSCILI